MTETRNEPEILVLPTPDASFQAAAERIARALADAATERGVAHWVTTGGSTPGPIYRRLANSPLRESVPWASVHIWFGDERFVPVDHPQSNAKIVLSELLEMPSISGTSGTGGDGIAVLTGTASGVLLPPANFHPIPTGDAIGQGRDAAWAAERYIDAIRASGPPTDGGWPVFDLVLLGMGPDGHLMSVFPGSEAFDVSQIALPIPAPTHVEPHIERVTLHPRLLDVARAVLMVVNGDSKSAIAAEVLESDADPRRLPAQAARRAGATWILDEAAAGKLHR